MEQQKTGGAYQQMTKRHHHSSPVSGELTALGRFQVPNGYKPVGAHVYGDLCKPACIFMLNQLLLSIFCRIFH